ncbi:ankyrin repeat domain-containing protein [Ovoidimarina sediminis]|uniref:ankyrin repeat domain-containing protein n=1 Tax=Ovoidimarina sediminis TaxID=3079856 RepID=UPI002915675B|nr:ankyrin repeat domain-containing protein [Rhodophyticola sp. MJ-SS7]MDU8946650.1 ankyrin repeat domain-containing protein [Rhodophyticola sp. MJ-SS7]
MSKLPVLTRLPILLALCVASPINPVIAGPLHDAVRTGNKAAVLEAVAASQDVNETDFFLGAPLHVAVVEERPEMVRILLEAGAEIDAPSELEARTALHLAADVGDEEMVLLLLQEGADPHAVDRSGKQAIHLATISGHSEVVANLLSAGVMVDSREPGEGMTPLLIASLQGEVELVELLVSAGADIEATNATGRTPFFFSTSMESFANVGDDKLIRYFAERGVELAPEDNAGITPLQWARSRNVPIYDEIAEILTGMGIER